MLNTTNAMVKTDVAVWTRAAASTPTRQHEVRITPPLVAPGTREKSALRTNGIAFSRAGHVPWSSPV